MKRIVSPLLLAGVLLLGAAGLAAGAPADAVTDIVRHEAGVTPSEPIDSLYRSFSRAYRDLDATALAALYNDEALYLEPNKTIRQGRDAIEASFAHFFARTRSVGLHLEIRFRIVERDISGTLAYDVGIYTLVSTRDGEEVGRSSGKFVIVTRPDVHGTWKFQVDAISGLGRDSSAS